MIDDEGKLDIEVKRGQQAELVLRNEIYQEAFVIIKAELFNQFQDTKYPQSSKRDEIWRQMQVVSSVENHLSNVMHTGKMAQETLLQKAKRKTKEKFKRVI